MVCAGSQTRHRTRKPVDLIEGPNKVFEGRSTKGPQLLLHQWRPQGRPISWFLGLCEVAIAPGCQRPPSNFSGSFACKGQGVGTDTWSVATRCPHFGLWTIVVSALILLLSPCSQEPIQQVR